MQHYNHKKTKAGSNNIKPLLTLVCYECLSQNSNSIIFIILHHYVKKKHLIVLNKTYNSGTRFKRAPAKGITGELAKTNSESTGCLILQLNFLINNH